MKNDIVLLEHLKVLQQKLSSAEVPNRKKVIKESLEITDISGESKFKGKQFSPKYFVLHHTGGKGTASDVIRILNCRHYNGSPKCTTLGIQWIIDRDGKLYQSLPKGSKGAHLKAQKEGMGQVTNSTSEGVEIVGLNNDDILIKQCKTALLLIKSLGHPLSNVYGHGEVSSNKNPNEGQRCKAYVTKYWNTPEDQLPEVDDEIGKVVEDPKEKDRKIFKRKEDNPKDNNNKSNNDDDDDDDDVDDDVSNDDKVTTTTTTTNTEKSNPFDFFKSLGGILKESKELKKQEDIQRIKNLLK
jgi:hypothetical protein